MHNAAMNLTTPHFLTLDSDCVILQGGFLEKMLEYFENPSVYAVGWNRWTNRKSGIPLDWYVPRPEDKSEFVAYAHPVMALFNTSIYRQLNPFNHHGASASSISALTTGRSITLEVRGQVLIRLIMVMQTQSWTIQITILT